MSKTSPNKKANTNGSKGAQKAKRPMIKCADFKTSQFSISEVEPDNERSKGQYIAYPRYKYGGEENCYVFKTGDITINQGGFPRIDDYHKTDEERDYFRLNLDPDQAPCKELETMCRQIDKEVLSKKKEILSFMKVGGKDLSELYEYSAIVREPEDSVVIEKPKDKKKGGNDKESKPAEKKMNYIKVKLDIDFHSKEIVTKVFMKNEDKELVKCDVTNVNKFADHLTWKSTAKFIIMANKLWIAKNKDTSGKRKFGVSFKCIQIDIVKHSEKSGGGGMRNKFADYAFDDDEETDTKQSKPSTKDSDDEDDKKPSKKESTPKAKVKTNDKKKEETDSESDEEDKKPVKSSKPAPKDSDNEGSDDDDKKATTKASGKTKPKKEESDKDSDSNSDSDEDDKKKKTGKREATPKKTKK